MQLSNTTFLTGFMYKKYALQNSLAHISHIRTQQTHTQAVVHIHHKKDMNNKYKKGPASLTIIGYKINQNFA